ncbi:hypothetical protein NDU88_010241 [Pleurodeles waltl]|uniref:Uncharacterized protein n=1 Tax=Pleurodeles waltl TaxID=8319 RepID=A0AAV7S223_PLEWA|nr:hypothetical protein NDU88_010241 [Pleurodeles waltl]
MEKRKHLASIEQNQEARGMDIEGMVSTAVSTIDTPPTLVVSATYNSSAGSRTVAPDIIDRETHGGESGVQPGPQEARELENLGTHDCEPRAWEVVQSTLAQLSQEIEERFAISEANQTGIQATCLSLETKVENLAQRTQDLEEGFQAL